MYQKILKEQSSLLDLPVLVADDSEISRKISEKYLREAGFRNLHFAKDGKEALDLVKEIYPRILVCDIFMPKLSGFELIKEIRSNPAISDIAILVHTASSNNKDVNDAFINGANDVILKPVQKEEFLTRCTIHLENSTYRKRISEELEKAKFLQASIIPSSEKLNLIKEKVGIETGFIFQPSSELGGDFWSIKILNENQIVIYCVDLTGHGIASAMNTFRVHSLIEENLKADINISEFLHKINNVLCEIMPIGQYATMFFGVIDIAKNTLSFSNAGAPYPMLCKENGEVKNLVSNALPIGANRDTIYSIVTEDFSKNDVLLVFSDALNESVNSQGEFFNEDKISKTLSKVNGSSAQEIADLLFSKFSNYIGKTTFDDDLTINVYKRLK
ncbi:MAG: SpoIIE family protein phosphatase [Rickettsiales bacterium]|nr:SpoIIE family protein phosphatase [Rickettsiales bacterium]